MRKIFKIILAVFLAIITFGVAGLSVVFLDVAAYTATGSRTLPGPPIMAKALVVYDPGITGAAKNIADKIAGDLGGYNVELAGIKSAAATANISQYAVIVVGGPIYAGNAADSVKAYLGNLKPMTETRIGVFGVGSFSYPNQNVAPLSSGDTLTIKETLKINTNQDATTESAQFVTKLLS
ncbi:MAG: flavodoxin family protein [Candidatus Bathyarchaeia archaeon]